MKFLRIYWSVFLTALVQFLIIMTVKQVSTAMMIVFPLVIIFQAFMARVAWKQAEKYNLELERMRKENEEWSRNIRGLFKRGLQ